MHLNDISDEDLEDRLMDERNLNLICESWRQAHRRLLHPDVIVPVEELPDRVGLKAVLGEVKEKVDSFLGVSEIKPPCVYYSGILDFICENLISICNDLKWKSADEIPSHYSPFGIGISKKEACINLPGTIAHEYAHHVQSTSGVGLVRGTACTEGHAYGVGMYISDYYSISDKSIWFSFHRIHGLLKQHKKANNPGDCHCMGAAAFYIEEMEQGRQIYRQLLDGTFEFKVLK